MLICGTTPEANKHQPAVDHAVAGHHAITRRPVALHAEVGAAVLDKQVPLFKGAFIEQQFKPLARRQFAFSVLRINALLPAAETGSGTLFFQLFKNVLHGMFSLYAIYLIAACARPAWAESRFRAAVEAGMRPPATSASSAGNKALTAGSWRKASLSAASMRSHIQASDCC